MALLSKITTKQFGGSGKKVYLENLYNRTLIKFT